MAAKQNGPPIVHITWKWSPGTNFVFLYIKVFIEQWRRSSFKPYKTHEALFSFFPPGGFLPFGNFVDSFLNNLQRSPKGCFPSSFWLKHHKFEHLIHGDIILIIFPLFVFQRWSVWVSSSSFHFLVQQGPSFLFVINTID